MSHTSSISYSKDFIKGLWNENAVLRQLLGLCPVLAVTNSAENGLAMGLATTFVVISSSILISIFKDMIPHQVRIAGYIIIIATFVTLADRFLAAYFPPISKSLGPYVPLIVVNCMILGRQESFASKNNPLRSFLDAAGMGLGMTFVLILLGSIREVLGSGSLFGLEVTGELFDPWMVMILPPGAFLTLGVLIALYSWINERRAV